MTYFNFLLIFVLAPALLLMAIYAILQKKRPTPTSRFLLHKLPWGIAVHVLLAVTYTTPWDNYLVATGVWTYNPDLVTGILLGYVPIEEYTFFVLETILVGTLWGVLVKTFIPADTGTAATEPNMRFNLAVSALLGAAWLFFTWQFFFGADRWNYLGIIFFWALPPIILQAIFGADILWRYRGLVAASIFLPGTYLSLTDIIALTETTWQISPTQTLGLNWFGILPLEEITFFFITATLITLGLTLFLSAEGQHRLQHYRHRLTNR